MRADTEAPAAGRSHTAEGDPRRAYAPPAPRGDLVVRERLVRALADDPDPCIVVVSAQAGYGKSTLLAQWAQADDRPFAWLTLGPQHDDAAILVDEVMGAVAEVTPLDGRLRGLVAGARPPISTRVLPWLGRELRASSRPFVLVLDDAHLLTGARAHEVLWVIATSLPPGSRLALGTRAAFPLREAVLRSRRMLRTVGARELAMDDAEAAELIARAGVSAGPSQVRGLVAATEGWPAGLYLAALALGERWPADGARIFAGDHHLVVDYVREELLGPRSEDEAGFLLGSSVLDQMTAARCDDLLGRTDSAVLLQALARENLFVVPLDPRHERFRYHQLFADALRAELQRRDPGRARALHLHACGMAAAAGDPDGAVRHALAAGDTAMAATIMWRALPLMLTRGRLATLERWVRAFPEGAEERDAHVALARAWIELHNDSATVAHWAAVAEHAGHEGPLADGCTLPVALAILRATVGRGGVGQVRRDAAFAYAREPDQSPWRAACCLFEGAALHLLGRGDEARARLEEGAARAHAQLATVEMLCMAWMGVIAVLDGDEPRARQMTDRSLEVIRSAGLEEYSTAAITYALAALQGARAGREAEARDHLMRARRLVAVIHGVAPFAVVAVRLVLLRAALTLGEPAVASVMLKEAEPFLVLTADSPVLLAEAAEARRVLSDMPAGAAGGPGALTSAEIRVLRFLPTHLSFREIGERLHVSRFTVKSQAMAVYRKLGVTSRSDAVERAAALGLIER